MPYRVLVIALLTLLMAWDRAHASDDEIREKQAILLLHDFRQWVDLKYQYVDQHANNGIAGTSNHDFQENYNGSMNGSILGPHLFNAGLTFTLGFDQNIYNTEGQSSSRSNEIRYNYQFVGTGLDRSVTPFSIGSYRNTQTVTSPYAPTYSSTTTGEDVSVTLRNVFLPSGLSYSHKTMDNSGGGFDTSTNSDTFTFTTGHHYKDISGTNLSVTASDARGTASGSPQSARAYSATLINALQWGLGSQYLLTSAVQLFDNIDQNVPQRNFNLTETFQDHLGKALDLQATYAVSRNTTTGFTTEGFTNVNTNSTTQSGELQLYHRLFESLNTRLKGRVSYQDLLDGYEFRYGEYGDLNYIKRLPDNNHLTISFAGSHEVIDNSLGLSSKTVIDEPHQGVQRTIPETVIQLAIGNGTLVQPVVIRAKSPLMTFEEGIDYTVDYARGQITILVDGRIDPTTRGQDIYITYTVKLDPVIKYSDDTINVNAGITFKGGRYGTGFSYTSSWMNLIHGPPNNSLRNSNMKMIYFNGNPQPLTYRIAATESDVGSLTTRTVDCSAQWSHEFQNGRMAIAATDRYGWYSATATLGSYTENATSVSTSGVYELATNLRLTGTANVFDYRSELRSAKDIASLRLNLNYTVNKTVISMDGQTSWTWEAGTTTRNDTVTVDYTRYF